MPPAIIDWSRTVRSKLGSALALKNPFAPPLPQPFSQKMLIRLLLLIIAVLAITVGIFQELYKAEQKKYARLEDRYVRVRDQLGRDVVQKIIDQSRQEE